MKGKVEFKFFGVHSQVRNKKNYTEKEKRMTWTPGSAAMMKHHFPRPRQISTAIYLLHLSDLPPAFYLNKGFCLHMAAHVSPDLTTVSFPQTVNTLNKWS